MSPLPPIFPPPFPSAETIFPPHMEIPEDDTTDKRRPPTPNTSVTRSIRITRHCHLCYSQFHLKKNCPRYQCRKCFLYQPGHLFHECTVDDRTAPTPDDQGPNGKRQK
jgi:hypothetical protein